MRLYLMRHGEAVAENEDPERPLTSRGREEVDLVSRAAAKKGMAAAKILHSEKLRAKQTAEILAQKVTPAQGICEINGLCPNDNPIVTKAEIEASSEPLIVVGHLPHLDRLVTMLLNGTASSQVVDFPTASVVCLSRRKKDWRLNWTLDPAHV